MEVVASLSQNRTAAAQCGLFTYKSVPVIFEPPCTCVLFRTVSERELRYFTDKEFGFGAQYCPSFPPYCASLHFCLWGWMKSKVHRTKVDTRDELPDLIMDVIARINEGQDALGRATRHVLARVAKCVDVDGVIFENVLYYVSCTNFVT